MVEWGGLENRCALTRTVGSNPTPSAINVAMMKKRKILLTIPTLQGGGAERVMSLLANHWVAQGWNVTLATYEKAVEPFYNLDSRVTLLQLNVLSLNPWLRPFEVVKRIWKLRQLINNIRPEVVLSFLDMNNFLTIVASLGAGVPVVAGERTNPDIVVLPKIKKFLRDWSYGLADKVVVQTDRTKGAFSEALSNKMDVIPNPIVVQNNYSSQREKKIVSVGRLSEEKRYPILIEAFERIAKKHEAWNLEIFGEGPERPAIENLIKERHLEERIKLMGRVKNIHEEMNKGAIFAFASRFEGMPNALCEAMALGLPVISTDCPTGPREVIDPDENGFLIPVDDVAAMATSIDKLIKDENLREKFGKAAQEKMKDYAIDKIAAMWEETFEQVIQCRKR